MLKFEKVDPRSIHDEKEKTMPHCLLHIVCGPLFGE